MVPDNFKILIDKLKEKTTKKEAIWSKTSRDNEFKLDLGRGAITVDRWKNEHGEGLVDISIMNEHGDQIDYTRFHESERDDYNYLIELHSLAKRAYYKVDETFKTIFEELDSGRIIGTDEKYNDFPISI